MAMRRNGGWWESMSNFLTQFNQPNAPPSPYRRKPTMHTQQPALQPAPQQPAQDSLGVILMSAQRNTLALMLYNGNWRYVEPYSYRARKNGTTDLMAFCHRHQRIEAFKPNKIEAAQATDMAFRPRWPVEIGRE